MTIPMRSDYHSLHLLELVEQRQVLEEHLVVQSNLNIRDNEGRNALYWAIENHSKKNLLLLLSYEISLNVAPNLHAMFHAIEVNNVEALAAMLILGSNINTQNDKNQSLLMKALEKENIVMVQHLINKGIDLYLMDENYDMALDYAKRCKNQRVFELVHYKVLNDKALENQSNCMACPIDKKLQCTVK